MYNIKDYKKQSKLPPPILRFASSFFSDYFPCKGKPRFLAKWTLTVLLKHFWMSLLRYTSSRVKTSKIVILVKDTNTILANNMQDIYVLIQIQINNLNYTISIQNRQK